RRSSTRTFVSARSRYTGVTRALCATPMTIASSFAAIAIFTLSSFCFNPERSEGTLPGLHFARKTIQRRNSSRAKYVILSASFIMSAIQEIPLPVGTAFHERTFPLCTSLSYREWSGYYTVSSYETHHEHEYNAIRNACALIDITPLYKYIVSGKDATRLVNRVIARDINKVKI